MAQNVILHVCDLERSRSSMKVKMFSITPRHLPIKTLVKFHRNLIDGLSVTTEQSFTKIDRKLARRKSIRRNNLTDVDIL